MGVRFSPWAVLQHRCGGAAKYPASDPEDISRLQSRCSPRVAGASQQEARPGPARTWTRTRQRRAARRGADIVAQVLSPKEPTDVVAEICHPGGYERSVRVLGVVTS